MKIQQQWVQKDSDFIRSKLIEYNISQIPETIKTANENISFVVRDEQDRIVAGITGHTFWYHMHVDFLWVDSSVREKGYGSQLLAKMEELAKEKGCTFIYLDTFSFQAPKFYQKNGYKVFGKLEDFPGEVEQYFLQKKL